MARSIQNLLWEHRALLVLIALAVAIHTPIYGDSLNFDASTGLAQAWAIGHRGRLDIGTTLVPNHPPGVAIADLPFCFLLGYKESAIHTLQLVFLSADIFVLYIMSRKLGRFALVPGLLLAVDPIVFLNMSEGRALTVLIFWTLLTLWGIWKGLENSRWLVLAAIGAAMGFLTSDAVGYLFPLAGGIGFSWRFYYVRFAVFRDRGYLAAIALFCGVVGTWSAYSLATTGSPFTDSRTIVYLNHFLFDTPLSTQVIALGGFFALFALYVVHSALPFLAFRGGRAALIALPSRAFHDQRIGAMVLFIGVVIGVASLMSSTFLLYEPGRSVSTSDTYLRYAAVVAPITYMAIGMHARTMANAGKVLHWAVPLGVALLLLCVQYAPKVSQGDANAAFFGDLNGRLHARNYTTIYSEGAIALRYNLPEFTFIAVDKGFATPTVNMTTNDVPLGAAMVTSVYVPKAYDAKFGSLFFIDHFDPAVNSPFVNTYYST